MRALECRERQGARDYGDGDEYPRGQHGLGFRSWMRSAQETPVFALIVGVSRLLSARQRESRLTGSLVASHRP